METTVRVDLQKLQILSDRIAQTLEAVNQLRLSAYNYGMVSQYGYRPEYLGQNFMGFNHSPYFQQFNHVNPGFINPVIAPFAHTPTQSWGMASYPVTGFAGTGYPGVQSAAPSYANAFAPIF